MAHSNKTQGDLMRPFLKKVLQFLCAIYGTNVQIERTWKDSLRVYQFVVELKLKLGNEIWDVPHESVTVARGQS